MPAHATHSTHSSHAGHAGDAGDEAAMEDLQTATDDDADNDSDDADVEEADEAGDDDADNDGDEAGDDSDDEAARRDTDARRQASATSRLMNLLPVSTRFWNAATLVLLLASVLFLLGGHTDATFVLATLGLVAWFLNMRNRLHKGDVITGEETLERGEDDDDSDEHN